MNPRQDTMKRAQVGKMARDELEDQHLRILDENTILKAHARKQEEKIKKMATKLVRLVNDKKKQIAQGSVKRTARDVEQEEKMENLQDEIRKLNKDNEILRQKLQLANQQMLAQNKRSTPYGQVTSRIDSRLPRKPGESPQKGRGLKSSSTAGSFRSTSPRYGHSLLEEARTENHHLHEQVLVLQNQIANMQEENDALQQELKNFRSTREHDVLKFREHVNASQRTVVDENIELIKVQRQLKEKSNGIIVLEERFEDLKTNYRQLKDNYNRVLHDMERLKTQLRSEEDKSLSLHSRLKQGGAQQQATFQLREQVRELEREVEILKEANENLLNSAYDHEKERQWRQLERKLRVQIAQLEAAVKSDVAEKDLVLEKMAGERDFTSRLHSDSRKMHEESARLRKENEELRERLRLYTLSDDAVDVDELREALSKIRQKRHAASQLSRPNFLENVDDEAKDIEMLYMELQAQHAETIQELDKTREMLLMQHKINKDYQIEVECIANQKEEMKREYENKLDRFARLLDARAARIKKVETQLHDVAYGTKQFKFQPEKDCAECEEEMEESIQLERGENLFEINISKLSLSKDALIALDDREPSLFVTYAFYDYDLVSTPILKSANPLFDFTAQFTVKVDDMFLHHIQKESTVFEIHQAFGVEHTTIAVCKIRFNQLLDKSQGKLHGSVPLTGLNGSDYGNLDFWVRLRVPMDQAIRLYRERTKALGYLAANTNATQKKLDALESELEETVSTDNTNQLLIQIMSCNQVHARREGVQPSIYCVYKFFDFADHDTAVIPNSNNPHFDDRQAYPLQMNADLDTYLKSEKLIIYVFDDTDPDIPSYLGKAVVDLIPLAHNRIIKAPFQLTKSDGSKNGTVEISLRWQLQYLAPGGVLKAEKSAEDEEEIEDAQKLVKKPPVTPKKRSLVSKLTKPLVASTPKSSAIAKPAQDTATTSPIKKVSIIEPVKEKPVPLARSVRVPAERPDESEEAAESQVEDVQVHDDIDGFEAELSTILQVAPRKEQSDQDEQDLIEESIEEVDEGTKSEVEESGEEDLLVGPTSPPPTSDDTTKKAIPSDDEQDKFLKTEEESFDSEQAEDEPTKTDPVVTVQEKYPVKENEEPQEDESEDDIAEDIEVISDAEETVEDRDRTEEEADDDDDEEEQGGAEDSQGGDEEEDAASSTPDEPTSTVRTAKETSSETVRISINHLTLDPKATIWDDFKMEQVFAEYEFLGSVEEMPDAVPMPKSRDEKINFNYENVTKVDANDHQEQRSLLSNMIETGQSSFKVTIVSEPVNDDEEECEEIGTASVDLANILRRDQNITGTDIPVDGVKNPQETIGKLNVDVEALSVLRAIQRELNARMREQDL